MNTTSVNLEIVLIGMESLSVIFLCILAEYGIEATMNSMKVFNEIFGLFVLMGMSYILGITVDRLADFLTSYFEKRIKNKYKLKSQSSILIKMDQTQFPFIEYTRSRIRITRSTVVNFLLIYIAFCWFDYAQLKNYSLWWIVTLFCVIMIVTNCFAWFKLTDSFYEKMEMMET